MSEPNSETGLVLREVHVNSWAGNSVRALLLAAAALEIGILVWQGLTASGNPNPVAPGTLLTLVVLPVLYRWFEREKASQRSEDHGERSSRSSR